ncbi:MAG TPA: hypothetical protein DCE42_21325 [Myxococcales bacterium]|nr:hypothetical protein [Deltaproteobacteria bacterium]MBU54850.1 hypothetical protein [Deltaproteobacteria bacterium]HAA57321.1 hypothetical protein [Myxococcales bacterium]
MLRRALHLCVLIAGLFALGVASARVPPRPTVMKKRLQMAKAPKHLRDLFSFRLFLEKGMRRVLHGTAPKKAFAPYPLRRYRPYYLARFLRKVRERGIVNIRMLGLELDFRLLLKKKSVYKIRTVVQPQKPGVVMLQSRGYKYSYGRYNTRQSLRKSAPFLLLGAQRILERLQSPACASFPLLNIKTMPDDLPERLMRKIKKGTRRTAKRHAKLCRTLKELVFDDVVLGVDDVMFWGFDKDGKTVGMVSIELRLIDDQLYISGARVRPLR